MKNWTDWDQSLRKILKEYFGDETIDIIDDNKHMDFFRDAYNKNIEPENAFLMYIEKRKHGEFKNNDTIKIA